MIHKPMVLILCTGNSCRSQMAEAFLRHFAGDRFEVRSAGTDPKSEVHPLAIRVMNEIGMDLSAHRPKALSEFLGRAPVRHVLIVCDKANGTCPRIWPGAITRTYLPFADPADFEGTEQETLQAFRDVRDEIREAMKTWQPEPARVGGPDWKRS